jgi:hypothetical protein
MDLGERRKKEIRFFSSLSSNLPRAHGYRTINKRKKDNELYYYLKYLFFIFN